MASMDFNGSGFNTNELAFVVNKILSKRAIPTARRKNAFLYMALGKTEPMSTPGATGFERLMTITGKDIEQPLMGQFASPSTVLDANQLDLVNMANGFGGSHNASVWGAATWKYAHYSHFFGIRGDELQRFTGPEMKMRAFLEEFTDYVQLSYENIWGTAMSFYNAADTTNYVDPTRGILGSHIFAIGGGQNLAGASDWANGNNYGTIHRNDVVNADFRGQVRNADGDFTLGKLSALKNACIVKGDAPSVGMFGETLYGKFEGLVAAYSQATYNDEWNEFMGSFTRYGGIRGCLDAYMNSAIVTVLTPRTWKVFANMTTFASGPLVESTQHRDLYMLPTKPWMQVICTQPSVNGVGYYTS